jgi:hypothetical protein
VNRRLVTTILAGALVTAACSFAGMIGGSKTSAKRKTVKSTNGAIQLSVPDNWIEDRSLNDQADLQVSDRRNEMYVIVISESKEDFNNIKIESHSEFTRNALTEGLANTDTSPPTRLTISGNPALQYEIRGTTDNLNVAYLHTTVETPKKFHQVVAWTMRSRFEKNQALLQEVTQSLKEPVSASP